MKDFAEKNHCACTIGLGGGKAIDTAKCVAMGHNLIICPTIAATDAPTSHSAVMYHDDHSFDDYAYFKQSPSVVLIDLNVIANAPTRFLVSGMGDALSTYFEARANKQSVSNVNAGLPCGANRAEGARLGYGTYAAQALAELCYQNLLSDGVKAKTACDCNVVTPAFEKSSKPTFCFPVSVLKAAALQPLTQSTTASLWFTKSKSATSTAKSLLSAPSANSFWKTLRKTNSTTFSHSATA